MNTKEILVEINNLQGQINNLRECVNKGVYNYLKDAIGIESCGSAASDSCVGKDNDTAIGSGFDVVPAFPVCRTSEEVSYIIG